MPLPEHFSLLVKPASWRCNLRCAYCFYLKKRELFDSPAPAMSDATLENMIRAFGAAAGEPGEAEGAGAEPAPFYFGWQGGEPAVMGLDFYRRAVELQKKLLPGGHPVGNGFQTNGTLLSEDWAKFFRRNGFLVGLSVDGPKRFHDANRKTAAGEGSFERVNEVIGILQKQKVAFNAMVLVNAVNAGHPLEVYDFLVKKKIFFHQYIECVEFDGTGKLREISVSGERWGEFLCRIFDRWYKNDIGQVSVRLFDAVLHRLLRGGANCCTMAPDCRSYMVVEHDGSVFPCDFHVEETWRLGNVNEQGFAEMAASPLYRDFGMRKQVRPGVCRSCPYLELCQGCCPKNRCPGTGASALCRGWKMFFEHTLERFIALASEIDRRTE